MKTSLAFGLLAGLLMSPAFGEKGERDEGAYHLNANVIYYPAAQEMLDTRTGARLQVDGWKGNRPNHFHGGGMQYLLDKDQYIDAKGQPVRACDMGRLRRP